MSNAVVLYLLLEEERSEKLRRKTLRDCSNPLELPETAIIGYYRLNKEAFRIVLDAIKEHLSRSKIPPMLQLAASLRFLAEGSYQRAVGNDSSICLGRSTVSTILDDLLNVIERYICPQWVQLEMDSNEKQRSRDYFYNNGGPALFRDSDSCSQRESTVGLSFFVKPLARSGYFSINSTIMEL